MTRYKKSPCILDGAERLVDSLIHDKIDFDDIVTAINLVIISAQQSAVRHGIDIPILRRNHALLLRWATPTLTGLATHVEHRCMIVVHFLFI